MGTTYEIPFRGRFCPMQAKFNGLVGQPDGLCFPAYPSSTCHDPLDAVDVDPSTMPNPYLGSRRPVVVPNRWMFPNVVSGTQPGDIADGEPPNYAVWMVPVHSQRYAYPDANTGRPLSSAHVSIGLMASETSDYAAAVVYMTEYRYTLTSNRLLLCSGSTVGRDLTRGTSYAANIMNLDDRSGGVDVRRLDFDPTWFTSERREGVGLEGAQPNGKFLALAIVWSLGAEVAHPWVIVCGLRLYYTEGSSPGGWRPPRSAKTKRTPHEEW